MNPCGVIATYMSRQDWQGKSFWVKVRTILFNFCLLIGQLTFMIAGTAYGKVKWDYKPSVALRLLCVFGLIVVCIGIVAGIMGGVPLLSFFNAIFIPVHFANYRGIPWRKVWRAAQCSHVRLCLRKKDVTRGDIRRASYHGDIENYFQWDYINFGYPEAKIQPWRINQCKGQFEYRDPTFPTPPEFMEPVIQYAEDQVGKKYDELQLISSGLHLIAWIVYPWRWGQELKVIKAFNRKGGLEDCISGLTACLRWGEKKESEYRNAGYIKYEITTKYFSGYSTATTFPCQVELSENWIGGDAK